MDDFAALQVRIDANADRFNAGMSRTRAQFDRTAASIEARAGRLDTRLAGTGARFGRSFQIGNVAAQFQDIAVQAQMGTNALTIFAQQGPQIASAFGPAGAVVGAFIGVAALAGSALLAFGGEAKSSKEELDRLALSTGALDGGVRDLEQTARAYADAISATAAAQSLASGSIVADTKAEFEAKRSLLELEIKRQQALQAERRTLLATVEGEIAARPDPATASGSGRNRRGQQLNLEERLREYEGALPELQDRRKQLEAEAALAEIAIEKALEASQADFADLARRDGGGGRGGGGSRSRPAEDFTAGAQKRIRALREEAAGIGLVGAELERLRVRQAASALEQDLLAKARKDGTEATEEERIAILGLKVEYIQAADNVIRLKEAEAERLETLKDTAKATEEARRGFESFANGITNAVSSARSLKDALISVGVQIASAGLQGLFGLGPLGPGFRQGGLTLPGFAHGTQHAPGGLAIVGEQGPELVRLPRASQVIPAPQTAAMLRGGGGGGARVINIDARGATNAAATAALVRSALAESEAKTVRIFREMERRR